MTSKSPALRPLSEVTFRQLVEDRVLAPIHVAFADLISRLEPECSDPIPLAAALVSDQLARGHVCLDLRQVPRIVFTAEGESLTPVRYTNWPALSQWSDELQKSAMIETRTATQTIHQLQRPLVYEVAHQRLYLARYWFFQQKLAVLIAQRLQAPSLILDEQLLAQQIEVLFPNRHRELERDQCLAAVNAIDQRFAVITGGPGTGKTTTVAKLLALRVMQHATPGANHSTQELACPPLRILLMAPTGKAAQRLNESLTQATDRLSVHDDIKAQLKSITAGTIHRVLGWTATTPEEGGPFRHHAQRPLDADVVLVDEASMVDIGLMWHLFDALRPEAQVILMGDRDQLASVEAGGVLSDLAGSGEDATCSTRHAVMAQRTGIQLTPPSDLSDGLSRAISTLRYSHRFSSESEFGRLAAAVRAGHDDEVIHILKTADPTRILWLDQVNSEVAIEQLVERAAANYRDYLDVLHQSPLQARAALLALSSTRVLCAHREGSSGERAINQRLVNRFDQAGWLRVRPGDYPGRALMVTANDYQQGLFNGDVGIVVPTPNSRGLSILLDAPDDEQQWRLVPASLVPETQDCWAMTIHKSQGSEFRNVYVALPEFESPILSRELLYTAITRVKDEVHSSGDSAKRGFLCIAARESVLRSSIRTEIRRTSGIRDAIDQLLPAAAGRSADHSSPATKVRVQQKFDWKLGDDE